MSSHDKRREVCDTLLKVMFLMVGEEYDPKADYKDGWYMLRTWSSTVEEYFKKFASELIRKELKLNKIEADGEVSWFNLMWGWKVDDAAQLGVRESLTGSDNIGCCASVPDPV